MSMSTKDKERMTQHKSALELRRIREETSKFIAEANRADAESLLIKSKHKYYFYIAILIATLSTIADLVSAFKR